MTVDWGDDAKENSPLAIDRIAPREGNAGILYQNVDAVMPSHNLFDARNDGVVVDHIQAE
jgi:hypothetical protein